MLAGSMAPKFDILALKRRKETERGEGNQGTSDPSRVKAKVAGKPQAKGTGSESSQDLNVERRRERPVKSRAE